MKKITLLFLSIFCFAFTWQSNAQTIVIGTGTETTTSTGSDPIDGFYNSFRYQVVYTAAELGTVLTPYDEITALGWSIAGDYGGGALLGYTIKIGHTGAVNSATHDASVTTVVKNPFDYDPTVTAEGVFDMITFDTNFVWNGTDNILVEVCSDGQNPFTTPYGQVRTTTVTSGSRSARNDNGTSCGVNTTSSNGNKPNVQFNYIDGTVPTDELDYYNLQWPPNGTIDSGAVFNVYAQAYEAGLTDVTTGQAPGILCWIGYSRSNTDPSGAGWTWFPATFDSEQGNNDQYMLDLGALATSGTYYYASRWNLNGAPYTYGGIQADGTYGGAWGVDNNISGVLTVNAPSNDDCANAIALIVNSDLACGVVASGTVLGASDSGADDATCSGTPDDDVWYSFVATSTTHQVVLSNVVGSATDMYHVVYDGTGGCGALGASIKCSDADTSNTTGLVIGNTYYVQVYTYTATNGQTTTFDICIGTPPPAPENDECAGAFPLTESTDSSCANAVSGTTSWAGPSASGTCSTSGKDVWYTFTPSQTASYIFNVTETEDFGFSSTYVSVYSGSCGTLTQVGTGCSNTSATLALTAATEYYVVVRSTSTTAGVNFDLCVYPEPAPPANDECAGALPLTESADTSCANAVSGTTISAGPTASGTCSASGKDVWYTFTPLQTASYVFNVTETEDFGFSSTYVSVYSGSCGALTQVGTGCSSSIVTLDVTAATEYYVVVRSSSTTTAVNFDLCVFPEPAPPVNDECAGALPLTESADSSCANAVSGTTVSAGPSASGTCSASGKDVWYTFTPSQTLSYIFNVTETEEFGSTSTYVSVYSGSCGTLTQVGTGCSNSTVISDLTAATQYYVVVRSTSSTNAVNFDLCVYPAPPPPANDACSGAIALTPGITFDANPVVGYNYGATGSGELPLPGCATYDPNDASGFGGDVWYAVTVPADGNLTIETNANPTGSGGDSGIAVYTGTCGALSLFECDDDDSPDGAYSLVSIDSADNLANQTVFVRVWEYGGDAYLNFQVSAYSGTLSVIDVEQNGFTYFPNPVKNTLNLKAQSAIQNVSIYNMLGQEVLRTSPNSLNSEVNMGSLQTGAYFVKVTINNATETIRVIKQ